MRSLSQIIKANNEAANMPELKRVDRYESGNLVQSLDTLTFSDGTVVTFPADGKSVYDYLKALRGDA